MLYVGRNDERERVGAARGQTGDLLEGHPRAPAHDRVPDVVDAAAPGASR